MYENEIPLGRAKNLQGQKFGRLTPLYRTYNTKNNDVQWVCKCDCGKEKTITTNNLVSGHTRSCGCLQNEQRKINAQKGKQKISKANKGKYIINEINNQYDNWLVINISDKIASNGAKFWLCKCQKCGYEMEILGSNLRLNRYPKCPACTDKLSIIGQKFNKLTVLEVSNFRDKNNGTILYKCQCDCGNIVYRRRKQLKDKHYSSCGCDTNYKRREELKKQLIGKQIDDLLILSLNENKFLYGEYTWNCQCKCGNIIIRNTSALLNDKEHYHSCNDCARKYHRISIGTKIGYLELKNYIEDENNILIGYQCYCYKCNQIVDLDCHKYRNITRRRGELATCGCDVIQSYGEEKIKNILNQNNINYIFDKRYFKDLIFPKTNGICRFDFIILNKENKVSYIIEYDGKQHFDYKDTGWNNEENYILTHEHDLFKNQYCFNNNIILIRIPYWHLDNLKLQDLLPEISTYILTKNNELEYYN